MRKIILGIVAAGSFGVAAMATPAFAVAPAGIAPSVESNLAEVQRRCRHHRRSSRVHCRHAYYRYHHRPYYNPYYAYPAPYFAAPFFFRHHHHRRHHW